MSARAAAVAVLVLLSACMAGRAPVEESVAPLAPGITPLTLEQDDQLGG